MEQPNKSFYIQQYGAVPDGKILNTKAIQKTIDACHAAGGGRVYCPAGIFMTGSIELKDNVELHLAHGCQIVGSTNPDDYRQLISKGFDHANAPERTADFLVGASYARNIAITGAGEINASGPAFYDQAAGVSAHGKFASGKPARRPRLLMFHKCTDVLIADAAFVDSPCWTLWLMMCENVKIRGIRITGDERMINNDGIDIDSCRRVAVSDCFIRTDDDCIVVRAMQPLYDEPAVCENVVVTNCVLESTCQGIRIGCPTDAVVRNCAFSNTTITGRGNGIVCNNPKRYWRPGRASSLDVSNMVFDNFVVDCGRHPIKLDVEDGLALKRVAGFSFSNFRIKSGAPILLAGSPETIIRDVSFSHIAIETAGDNAVSCRNCHGVKLDNVTMTAGK